MAEDDGGLGFSLEFRSALAFDLGLGAGVGGGSVRGGLGLRIGGVSEEEGSCLCGGDGVVVDGEGG